MASFVYFVIMQQVAVDRKGSSIDEGVPGLYSRFTRSAPVTQHKNISRPESVPTNLPNRNSSVLLAGVPRRNQGYLTIGIPTLKRPKGEYFFNTLASLFNQSTPSQQQDMTVVVMLGDRDPVYNKLCLQKIQEKYPAKLREGLLLAVSSPNTDHLFEDDNIKRTFNDSVERVRWRSKQNLDYGALMEISANLSTYYLQIEDDVTAAPNYVQHIQDFVRANSHRTWAGLEVCPHGFIGKLFRSADLAKLVTLLRTFYLEMPCDFLIQHFYRLMLQTQVIRRKGNLFFHQGKYSSLNNVIRKTDKIPEQKHVAQVVKKAKNHVNPPATLYTSMTVYKNYAIAHAYKLDSVLFFWAKDVKDGDYVTIVFKDPIRMERLVVESGYRDKAGVARDIIHNATVEYGERAFIGSRESKAVCTDTQEMGEFRNGRFEKSLDTKKDVKCITIVITHSQKEWVVIGEIAVYLQRASSDSAVKV
ncbi:alpha-1,3-mannosyl-glycoprotein 4-beta-N-acetylglucosaminyltransferase C-like [Littorina saxatilis]|uniref:Uncharacterized protein n=1 Tax=Littorina saxatilis TaxID=31220 RepID=A0AAN9AXC7_9CAEN